jgi:hypothetical protein
LVTLTDMMGGSAGDAGITKGGGGRIIPDGDNTPIVPVNFNRK